MIKILSASEIRTVDAATLRERHMTSEQLMENAAIQFYRKALQLIKSRHLEHAPVHIFCGPSNNGGDGLAVAMLMQNDAGMKVFVYLLGTKGSTSQPFQFYLRKVKSVRGIVVSEINSLHDLPRLSDPCIVIDALFGTGLNRPLEGIAKQLVDHLNHQPGLKLAVDLPSGLFADRYSTGVIFQAHHTITFQTPKLSFLFAESQPFVGLWEVVDIGLSKQAIASLPRDNVIVERSDIVALLRPRQRFDHKGVFGHALLFAGNKQTAGAALLATRACVVSGAGRTTTIIPPTQQTALNVAVPEAMTIHRSQAASLPLHKYQVLAAGPGIGTDADTRKLLFRLLAKAACPLVLDADALNLWAREKKKPKLPPNSLLTPHAKEFERLAGPAAHWQDQLEKQRTFSQQHRVYVLRKGAYTCISTPEGTCYFNPTGNPGLAKGGTGDILTGILAALIAQGYDPLAAALIGCYLHGYAADLAVANLGEIALTASQVIDHIGPAFQQLLAHS